MLNGPASGGVWVATGILSGSRAGNLVRVFGGVTKPCAALGDGVVVIFGAGTVVVGTFGGGGGTTRGVGACCAAPSCELEAAPCASAS